MKSVIGERNQYRSVIAGVHLQSKIMFLTLGSTRLLSAPYSWVYYTPNRVIRDWQSYQFSSGPITGVKGPEECRWRAFMRAQSGGTVNTLVSIPARLCQSFLSPDISVPFLLFFFFPVSARVTEHLTLEKILVLASAVCLDVWDRVCRGPSSMHWWYKDDASSGDLGQLGQD